MWWVPSDDEYMPVIIVELAGAQTGALANACSYTIPSFAKASRYGVFACSLP